MIDIIEQDGKRLVCSLDIYKSIIYNKKNYSRWLKIHVYGNADRDIDYFEIQRVPSGIRDPSGPKCVKLGFTFEFAIVVCLLAKTEKAKKLKKWLQANRYGSI